MHAKGYELHGAEYAWRGGPPPGTTAPAPKAGANAVGTGTSPPTCTCASSPDSTVTEGDDRLWAIPSRSRGERRVDRRTPAGELQLAQQSAAQEGQDLLNRGSGCTRAGRLVTLHDPGRLRGIERRLTKTRKQRHGIDIERPQFGPVDLGEPDVDADLGRSTTSINERIRPPAASIAFARPRLD